MDVRTLAARWLPAEAVLRVDATANFLPGRRVALKLGVATGSIDPVFGTVRAAGVARGARVADVRVDAECVPALQRVVDFLEGRSAPPHPRPPRYRVVLPATVSSAGGTHLFLKTTTLSLGGCSLAWNAHRPQVGAHVAVRVGGGRQAPSCRARVCWVRSDAEGFRVGLRFLSSDQLALAGLIREHAGVEAGS